MADADILTVLGASTTSTASCWTCRSRRRRVSRGRGRDSLRAWMTRVRCARTWNGRRRKSREFQPLSMKAHRTGETRRLLALSPVFSGREERAASRAVQQTAKIIPGRV